MNWVAHRDSRSLFERAWLHGIGSGIITPENQEAISREGTRAIRKIASVLGSENLRADLERAMRSMLGLVNLHLEKISQGDIRLAARSIADNGLLFHTRGASNDIKRILAIRDGIELEDIDPEQKQQYEEAVVSSWAQYSFADFMQQYEDAERVRRRRDAAGAISQALQGEAPDAETLMRSRYSAYALGLHDYLLQTWHPDTRPRHLAADEPGLRWLGLQVLRHDIQDADRAQVAFVARFKVGGDRAQRLTEHSRFVRVNGRWLYRDAVSPDVVPPT